MYAYEKLVEISRESGDLVALPLSSSLGGSRFWPRIEHFSFFLVTACQIQFVDSISGRFVENSSLGVFANLPYEKDNNI